MTAGIETEANFAGDYYRNGSSEGTEPTTLDAWSFARNLPAYATSDGVLVPVAADEPRLTDEGILIEQEATNLALFSSDRTNAAWYKLDTTVTANATSAPDGTMTADKIVETSTTTVHALLQIDACQTATAYVYSEFVKAAGRDKVRLVENNGTSAYAIFDLATGEVVEGPGVIEAYADGWFRCSLRFTTRATQSTYNCQIRLLDAAGNQSYAGDGTSGLFAWGAQIELGKRASSPIATTGAAKTRPTDVAHYSAPSDESAAILVEAVPGEAMPFETVLADWSAQDDRLVLTIKSDRRLFAYVSSGGVSADTYLSTAAPDTPVRVAVRWDETGFQFFMNGQSFGSASGAMPVLDQISVGTDNVGGSTLGGKIIRIVTFSPAPSFMDLLNATASDGVANSRCIRIAAADSSSEAQAAADLVCDGFDDQVEINLGITAMSEAGGNVLLANGTYNVRRTVQLPIPVDPLPQAGIEVIGAVLMTSNNCSLIGESRIGTIIRLDNYQYCNVIRWVGNGLTNTAIRSLTIDPNLTNNTTDIATNAWLENCGVKTRTTGSSLSRDIRISDIQVEKSDGLGVYLFGENVHLLDSLLKAAVHDVAELCSGSGGSISGCTAVIDAGDSSYYGFGSDAFDDFQITNNLTIVRSGGAITGAVHRTWPGNRRGTISGNVVKCDSGGRIAAAIHAYSFNTTITGNSICGHVDPGGWGTTRIDLNTTVLFEVNTVTRCEFMTSGDSLGTILPTSPVGKTRIVENNLEACVAPPSNAQLVYADNTEFSFP